MSKNICILPGDGVGPEVTEEAVKVLKSLDLGFDFVYGDIGFGTYERLGTPLPDETIEKVEKADATLFGAVTTPPNIPNYSSPILKLRKHFDLYANLRQCVNDEINMVIVRENTEGLYSGSERVEDNGDKAITEMIITRKGSERIIRFAFEFAKKKGFSKVTVVHKANVLRETCGLFRKVGLEVAEDYPEIEMQELLVDACAMQLIKDPKQLQVIVTTNMFGDILSDEASMLVGGLGVAYSGNIGTKKAVFESVHGSAPKYVGTHKINPTATIMAAKLMLEHLGFHKEALRVENAVKKAIADKNVTPDLDGDLTTQQVTESIIKNLEE
ncbi:isocitrate dehydrogenase [Candidatus Woesearchaeota archaeon]|nr:isocitrate dehydrogenase [Candidatus Woesearchaeota archaeon]|tara:strand:- start:2152 stop:3135 length:984 start_codon:yes stop_codon:yes gene_type:complete